MFLRLLLPALLLAALPAYADEAAYERVSHSGTLRCGYRAWPNWVEKDANTGAMRGAWVEVVEAAARTLNFKVEWTAEVGMGDFAAALNSGKIDAYCLATAPTDTRLAQAYFTTPAVYAAFNAYARNDDTRFDSGLAPLDAAGMRISANEGDESGIVMKRLFPHATLAEVPNVEGGAGLLLNVTTRKADVVITDPMTAKTFNETNSNALKLVGGPRPLAVFGASIVLPLGEEKLLHMMDAAIRDQLNLGAIDRIMAKYDFHAGSDYLPVALPYQTLP